MIRNVKFLAPAALLASLSLGVGKANDRGDPCAGINHLGDLKTLSDQKLKELAADFKQQSYDSPKKEGCRDAILGRINVARGLSSEASRYFSRAAQSLPELSDYFLLAKANAELRNQDFMQAKNIASALLDAQSALLSAQFKVRLNQVLAEIAFKQKDHLQIIKTHQELLNRGLSNEKALLFNLALSLKTMNRFEEADETLKRLLIHFPSSDEAELSEGLKGLSTLHLSLLENEKRFDKLIENLGFDRIVSDVDVLLSQKNSSFKPDEKSRLESYAIKSLVLNNRFEKGLSRAERRAKGKNPTSKDLENYAWSLAKVDHFIEASSYYARFSKMAKDPEDQARGCFFSGFSLYEARYYSMAQFAWQRCRGQVEKSSYYENYLWYGALCALLKSEPQKAHPLLTELMRKYKKSTDLEKYKYFTGYSLQRMHKKSEGDAIYSSLAKVPTYYGMLARRSLGLNAPRGKALAADALSRAAFPCQNVVCENTLLLHNLGFPDEARDYILKNKIAPLEKLALLQHTGNYHEVWRKSYLLKPSLTIRGDVLITSASMRASHPTPYPSIIDEMSKKYNVQKSLIYAIMGVESGYLSDATSYRGAKGLMQMMPFVAQDLANRLDLKNFSSAQLNEPRVAIELGALLLATLKRQFDKMPLVIAAYNAGPHHVQKWVNSFGHFPVDLFVEHVPFSQTRAYIKEVLPRLAINNALAGEPLMLAF